MDKDLKEISDHLIENGSDITSIKLLIDRERVKAAKEIRDAKDRQSNVFVALMIIWTIVLLIYFYNKESDTKSDHRQDLIEMDKFYRGKVDSLQNFVDTTYQYETRR